MILQKTYESNNASLNEIVTLLTVAYMPLNAPYAGENLDVSLPVGTVMTADVSVLHCLGIEFFSKKLMETITNFLLSNCLVIDNVF